MLEIRSLKLDFLSCDGLCLQTGDRVALSGPSGVGKSLFLRALADLIPNQGVIFWQGLSRDSIAAPDWRKKVTYMGAKTVWWVERVGDHFQDIDRLTDRLALLDLEPDVVNWPVSRLSSGEAQRLALLRVLEAGHGDKDRCLLLDEPTSALDVTRQQQVEGLLSSLGLPILFVSHDTQQIERFATRRWCIKNGLVREEAGA